MSTASKLDRDSDPYIVDHFLYRSMIGSLLYLAATRPNISFSVGVCARYQVDPRKQHILVVKRIIRFVNSTLNYGLCYSSESNSKIAGYNNVDWFGNKNDRKITSGGCFYMFLDYGVDQGMMIGDESSNPLENGQQSKLDELMSVIEALRRENADL
ncbi:secreted RxLR effector protein 161-like [Cornus florida]|uniref:secreted RxLR effector protein 161-like n=1 Tax=Cornus florida TaxID=4283 RepID=UPI00289B8D90|nr:secreted RxLR effector protein 161-like [Cornus florida]